MNKKSSILCPALSTLLLTLLVITVTPASFAALPPERLPESVLTLQQSAAKIERQLGLESASRQTDSDHPLPSSHSPRQTISGFTEAAQDVQLGTTEAGRIARINVREGMEVQAGTELLSLDDALEKLDVEHRQLKRDSKAELTFSRQRQALTLQKYKAAKRLLEAKAAISRDEFNQAKIEYAQAVADVARLESQEKMEAIEYELAVERLHRRTLRTPLAGTVVHLAKNAGELVQANEPLVRLVEATRGRFVGNGDITVGKGLNLQQKVCIRIQLAEESIYREATVTFLSPIIDTGSNLMEVKAEFDNSLNPIQLGGAAELTPAACPAKPAP